MLLSLRVTAAAAAAAAAVPRDAEFPVVFLNRHPLRRRCIMPLIEDTMIVRSQKGTGWNGRPDQNCVVELYFKLF